MLTAATDRRTRDRRRALLIAAALTLVISIRWDGWSTAEPPVMEPVLLRTDAGWEKAYVDSLGTARHYEDGTPMGAHRGWKRP